MKDQEPASNDYEEAVLSVLAFEFSLDDKGETETKIKRKLRAKKLGKYDQERIDLLRRFKDEVKAEANKGWNSKYHTGSRGEFANMKDFDLVTMKREMAAAFPGIPRQSVDQFIEYGIYLYYIR